MTYSPAPVSARLLDPAAITGDHRRPQPGRQSSEDDVRRARILRKRLTPAIRETLALVSEPVIGETEPRGVVNPDGTITIDPDVLGLLLATHIPALLMNSYAVDRRREAILD